MDNGRSLGSAAALLLLSGCTPPPYPEDVARQQFEAQDRALMASYIGRPFWTWGKASYLVCAGKSMLSGGCFVGRGQFTFDSFEGLDLLTPEHVFMHLTFADGRSGMTSINPAMLVFEIQDHDPMKEPGTYPSFLDDPKAGKAVAERRKLQGALLHMSEAQVLAGAWGKPDQIVDRQSLRRGLIEWWIYRDNNILVFEDGRLVEIRNPKSR